MRRARRRAVGLGRAFPLAAMAAGAVGCRYDKTITGTVRDFDTGAPIAGVEVRASQTGWGLSSGGVVWDKSFVTTATTDSGGAFTLHYRVGSSAQLAAADAEYSEFRHYYDAGAHVQLRLARLVPNYVALPSGFASVGKRTDGRFIGWDFAGRREVTDPDSADVIATFAYKDISGALRVAAHSNGGLVFVPQSTLGVDDDYLVFSDSAPASGYAHEVALDCKGTGGVLFVRTRDGSHYAKLAFTPNGFASHSGPGILRTLDLPYVYNPAPSRMLKFQQPPLPRGK